LHARNGLKNSTCIIVFVRETHTAVREWACCTTMELVYKGPDEQHLPSCLYGFNLGAFQRWGRRGRDRMVVGFTTTYAISAYHH